MEWYKAKRDQLINLEKVEIIALRGEKIIFELAGVASHVEDVFNTEKEAREGYDYITKWFERMEILY